MVDPLVEIADALVTLIADNEADLGETFPTGEPARGFYLHKKPDDFDLKCRIICRDEESERLTTDTNHALAAVSVAVQQRLEKLTDDRLLELFTFTRQIVGLVSRNDVLIDRDDADFGDYRAVLESVVHEPCWIPVQLVRYQTFTSIITLQYSAEYDITP